MLKSITEVSDSACILYRLLAERTPEQSISHKVMPTWEEHLSFIASNPYPHWYIIFASQPVGAVYLTENREIGIGIFNFYKGKGYGKQAVKDLIKLHPGRFLANVARNNTVSHDFFQKHFNGELLQVTYECSL